MSVRSAQSITVLFTTRVFATGVATNADSTPTGTLYVNGVADAASVTVTNITTGLYKAAVTLPTLAVGDVVDLRINATVSSVADNAVIWRDTKDIVIDSAGLADATAVKLGPSGSAMAQTARDIGLSVLLSNGTGTGQISLSSGAVTVGTNSDKTGYQLTSGYDPAKTAAQAGDAMTLTTLYGNALVAAIGVQIIGDHGSGSYVRNTEPLDAAGVRSAVGLAAADLDTQLSPLASFTFTVSGQVDANVQYVNDTQVAGSGTSGDPWGPV